MQTVGIIGGAGFIGSHLTQKFLAQGYRVKASVTDPSKLEKYAHLNTFTNANQLEIVALRVENKAQTATFVEGCHIIIHAGTPFQLEVKDPKTELLDPTLQGTEHLLEAASRSKMLEKLVFVASVASYNTHFPLPPETKNPTEDTFNEQDTPFLSEESHPYGQAKFLANQNVEQFIQTHPNLGFDITSVSPVLVVGKALSSRADSTSSGLLF
ncbi:MAG: NAD-dependent epimerase/dehydratase family protein [Bacteroidota bacterium]